MRCGPYTVVHKEHIEYYLDAGSGIGYRANSNQHWMIETYAARGIALDRAIFWEGKAAQGAEPYADVPPELFPMFTFYNILAPLDLKDGRNPLNVLTRLARPEDFVSVKIDIDEPRIEASWFEAILGEGPAGAARSVYAALIDELFWEHHFDFQPMRQLPMCVEAGPGAVG
ncbi:hypothetical protein GPECTOR_6g614 [Gonium pectorale]|uniref:Uncharacterized protein n=1 Tax=Gonium pectorale TaxID=33097 RepID=A0A150GUZ4_GONPE|nr:hypothetical protein GPECTOR_6g614 [Gonium pectorale]|eukprot:KXZ53697.1 hypothetical protein GPECTOR_6g614 [Gonium pectorale]